MFKSIGDWLSTRHYGWKIRAVSLLLFLVFLFTGIALIVVGIRTFPVVYYAIGFGIFSEIGAYISTVVFVHGYIGALNEDQIKKDK